MPETTEETSIITETSAAAAPSPSAQEFKTQLIDKLLTYRYGELGYSLKSLEGTLNVFEFIEDSHMLDCDPTEFSANFKEALNGLNAEDREYLRINISSITDIMDGIKIGNAETINSFNDIDGKEKVLEFISDPKNLDAWQALLMTFKHEIQDQ